MNLTEAIAKLRELNEPVPKPMSLPSEMKVQGGEEDLERKFHPDFRRYLLEASDVVYGTKEPVTVTDPHFPTDLFTVCEEAWEAGVPKDMIPVCEDNGDYYCMNKKGQVVFWSHDGATDEKWKDLATWIEEVWIGESQDDEGEEDEEQEEEK
jgi:hypothetical protein